MRGRHTPPAFCMNVKTKELLNLHFVSVRKQRGGSPVDNRWDPLPLCCRSVDPKWVTDAGRLSESDWGGPDDFEGVRRTLWRGRIVGRARKNRADSIRDYNILVLYVNDNFKWFRQNEIARDG